MNKTAILYIFFYAAQWEFFLYEHKPNPSYLHTNLIQ